MASAPGSGSPRSAPRAPRRARTCTSRSGKGRGRPAAARSIRCRSCSTGAGEFRDERVVSRAVCPATIGAMHDAVRVFPCPGGKSTAHPAEASKDARIAELAARQHGTVARRQLIALGLSSKEIERRIAYGRLHPVHRGVYAVGHKALSGLGRWMAPVLAAGDGAVLSHRSARALWVI